MAAARPGRMQRFAYRSRMSSPLHDVMVIRPNNPLEVLGHLLIQPELRPDWSEPAAAYVKRHGLDTQLATALDVAGIIPHQEIPPDALTRLGATLLGAPFASQCSAPAVAIPVATIDGGAAAAEIARLKARIAELEASAPDVQRRSSLNELVKQAQAARAQTTAAHVQDADTRERHSKFAASTFTLAYADLSTFHGGLEARIGHPNPDLRESIRMEHCGSADSQTEFTTGNYGTPFPRP